MAEKKEDTRIKRTKKLLKEGLTQLILQKSIKKISVRELADLVEINRGTFYLHYKDIYDLVDQIENELCERFEQILSETNCTTTSDTLTVFKCVCEFLDENKQICHALLSDNGDINFLLKIRAIISKTCFSHMTKDITSEQSKINYLYISSYFESGTVGILRLWLGDNSPNRKSAEEVAMLLKVLFMEGLDGITKLAKEVKVGK
ncbi:MAG: TetR/AcrR family transcriptional regulator [Clostridia bacterium]|nr:TetR/AcrR family transcriptional regulator [Clostridia bacterium]